MLIGIFGDTTARKSNRLSQSVFKGLPVRCDCVDMCFAQIKPKAQREPLDKEGGGALMFRRTVRQLI